MIKALAIFDCDNGYDCRRCRKEWVEFEEACLSDDYVDTEVMAYFAEDENDEKKLRRIYIISREVIV